MDKNHVTELFTEYLDGVLEESQRIKVEAHLKGCTSCTKELDEFKMLFKVIEGDKVAIPSERMRINFHKQLALEQRSQPKVVSIDQKYSVRKNTWTTGLMKIAASIILLVGAYLAGKYHSEENSNNEIISLTEEKLKLKQTAMLSLMENESASKRIQGVNLIEVFAKPDETIIRALSERMYNDKNTNVRLAAVEALSEFSASELVKSTFIKALGTEKDPSVQIAIIKTLVKIQEKKAVDPMRRLLEMEDTQPFVKKEINQVLSEII